MSYVYPVLYDAGVSKNRVVCKNPFKIKSLNEDTVVVLSYGLKDISGKIIGYRFISTNKKYWLDIPICNIGTMFDSNHHFFTIMNGNYRITATGECYNKSHKNPSYLTVDEKLDSNEDSEHISILMDGGFFKIKVSSKKNSTENVKNLQKVFFFTDFRNRFQVISSDIPTFSDDTWVIHFHSAFNNKAFSEKDIKLSISEWLMQFGKGFDVEVHQTPKMFHCAIYVNSSTIWNDKVVDNIEFSDVLLGNLVDDPNFCYAYIKNRNYTLRIPQFSMFKEFLQTSLPKSKEKYCSLLKYVFPMIIDDNNGNLALIEMSNKGNYLSIHANPLLSYFNNLFEKMDLLKEISNQSEYILPIFSFQGYNSYNISRIFKVDFEGLPFSKDDIGKVLIDIFDSEFESNKYLWEREWEDKNIAIPNIEKEVILGEDTIKFNLIIQKKKGAQQCS